MASDNLCVLGIDIGTSSVKVSILKKSTRSVQCIFSEETKASKQLVEPMGADEQNVGKIIAALNACMNRIDEWAHCIDTIAVTGQMHGVVLWKQRKNYWLQNSFDLSDTSNLYTWQDARCTREFLDTLPPNHFMPMATGFGCATLFWLQQYEEKFLKEFNQAGTIQDFIVTVLCNLSCPLMCEQNAASWGYFDLVNNRWDLEKLEKYNFPTHLLPKVTSSGSYAGQLSNQWFGIKKGTKVSVALGDFQCSFYALHENENDAVISISTSAQLAILMPDGFVPGTPYPSVIWAPYFKNQFLAEAASLNGGNVLAAFVKMLQSWFNDLGIDVPSENHLWEKLITLSSESGTCGLEVTATLFGERHFPDNRAGVVNINLENNSIGNVFRAVCQGIAANLSKLMPSALFEKANVRRIISTGTVLVRNPIMREEIEKQFTDIPVILKEECDAATGAALAMME